MAVGRLDSRGRPVDIRGPARADPRRGVPICQFRKSSPEREPGRREPLSDHVLRAPQDNARTRGSRRRRRGRRIGHRMPPPRAWRQRACASCLPTSRRRRYTGLQALKARGADAVSLWPTCARRTCRRPCRRGVPPPRRRAAFNNAGATFGDCFAAAYSHSQSAGLDPKRRLDCAELSQPGDGQASIRARLMDGVGSCLTARRFAECCA
jgi:hypothetical protein